MLKVRVIPCLDVKDGRVVKGVNFVDLRDAGDPVEAAAAYDAAGADELCFLDITASHEDRGTILDVVRAHRRGCFMPLTVGGGVRTRRGRARAAQRRRRQGVDQHRGGDGPRLRARGGGEIRRPVHRGRDRRQARVAAGEHGPRWEVFTHGGREPPASTRSCAREVVALGAGEILLTTMDRDGTKRGFDLELTRAVADAVTVPVIASGGVGTLEHLVEGVPDGHASAVLAASIFHYRRMHRRRGQALMAAAGLPVRLDG